ncbi:MAG: MurR/RpiR family transcriptional regulator [Clostridia bacterium]|nr:MurR/RpiR family transcriptional regulator [Clostridia bacterium]
MCYNRDVKINKLEVYAMVLDLAQRIKSQYSHFSKGQKRLATLIMRDCTQVVDLTAARLGELVGLSESTVVRFASVLGYDGYGDFQVAVQQLAKTKLTPTQRIAITKQRIGCRDIIENVVMADINKLRNTLENLSRDDFYNSVESILHAKRIYVIGARSTQPVAHLLSYNLSLIYDNVKLVQVSSTAEIFEQMFTIDEKDVLIAFSFPRYSSKVVNAVKFASSKCAKVVVVTDSKHSPLVAHADYSLIADTDMASFMDSVVAPISIINALIIEITHRREGMILDRFEKLERLWDDFDVYTGK